MERGYGDAGAMVSLILPTWVCLAGGAHREEWDVWDFFGSEVVKLIAYGGLWDLVGGRSCHDIMYDVLSILAERRYWADGFVCSMRKFFIIPYGGPILTSSSSEYVTHNPKQSLSPELEQCPAFCRA